MNDLSYPQLYRTLIAFAGVAGATLVTLMVGISITQGIGYQDFESILRFGDIAVYTAQIAEAAPVLRWIYPLDTLYIFSYLIMVFAMAQLAVERPNIARLAIIAVLATAFLDFVENNHIMSMANAAERGFGVAIEQITLESVITQTKFNAGLLLTLCLSFLIPVGGTVSFVARWLARGLVLCAPVALLTPATTLLYISMNIGLAGLIAVIYGGAASGNHLEVKHA